MSSVTPDPIASSDSSVTPDPLVTLVTSAPVIPTAPPVLEVDLDPLDALVDFDVEDPEPEIIEDTKHVDYVEPAADIAPRKQV